MLRATSETSHKPCRVLRAVVFVVSGVLVSGLTAGCGRQSVESDLPAAAAAGALTGPAGATVAGWAPNAVVERVVDGDTLVARIGDRSETVRLIGLDTPESVARSRPVQCYGPEASLFLQALLPEGTPITLLRDVEARDAYERLLGYVVRSGDGLFVNLEIVAAGYAEALTFAPNVHYAAAFERAERDAVMADRGLWGACGGPDVPLE